MSQKINVSYVSKPLNFSSNSGLMQDLKYRTFEVLECWKNGIPVFQYSILPVFHSSIKERALYSPLRYVRRTGVLSCAPFQHLLVSG
jgi:hypothetical protein